MNNITSDYQEVVNFLMFAADEEIVAILKETNQTALLVSAIEDLRKTFGSEALKRIYSKSESEIGELKQRWDSFVAQQKAVV